MTFGPNPVAVTALATIVAVLNVNVTKPVEVLIELVTAVPVNPLTTTPPPTTNAPDVETPTLIPPIKIVFVLTYRLRH